MKKKLNKVFYPPNQHTQKMEVKKMIKQEMTS